MHKRGKLRVTGVYGTLSTVTCCDTAVHCCAWRANARDEEEVRGEKKTNNRFSPHSLEDASTARLVAHPRAVCFPANVQSTPLLRLTQTTDPPGFFTRKNNQPSQ
jgi:endonuclease III